MQFARTRAGSTAVTNAAYGSALSANGTVIVWGSGFSAGGGNSLMFSRSPCRTRRRSGRRTWTGGGPGAGAATVFDETTGAYFWDSSATQINAALGSKLTPGAWTVSVMDACGVASAAVSVTLQ